MIEMGFIDIKYTHKGRRKLYQLNRKAVQEKLTKQGFKIVEDYQLNDIYLLPNDIEINLPILELLKQCVLIRDIAGIVKKMVYKYKEYDTNGTILKQGKTECEIKDIQEAIDLMTSIGYKELIRIYDKCIVYTNDNLEITVQLVNDKYIFIEIEDRAEHLNQTFDTIEEMIAEFEKLSIDYDRTNYFIKKAEFVFKDTYNK